MITADSGGSVTGQPPGLGDAQSPAPLPSWRKSDQSRSQLESDWSLEAIPCPHFAVAPVLRLVVLGPAYPRARLQLQPGGLIDGISVVQAASFRDRTNGSRPIAA